MADEIKKTTDEVKENTAVTKDGAIPDDDAEAVAGGKSCYEPGKSGFYKSRVHSESTLTDTRR